MKELLDKIIEKDLSLNTYKTYKSTLQIFFNEYENINYENIRLFLIKNKIKWKPATLQLRKNILIQYLNIKKQYNDIEKTQEIKLPPIVEEYRNILSLDQINKISNQNVSNDIFLNKRNNLLILFLYYTGLRCSEISNTKYEDIDINKKLLFIIGKGMKRREIYLHPKIWKLLKLNSNGYIFITKNNKRLSERRINTIIKNMCHEAKINFNVTPHTFRRSFCTNLIKNGANIKIVSKLMGHSKIETTAKYLHFTFDEIKNEYIRFI